MKLFKRKIFYILLIAVFLIILGTKKVLYLSVDPIAEKDCPPITPSDDENRIEVSSDLNWSQKGGYINDASCLDRTPVYGIVQVNKIKDISDALIFAKKEGIKISIAGVKHSMGGQAFAKNALILDMTKFATMELDENRKILKVESGATWHNIQNFLHPKFAVKAMQSTDIFTVGGSISVNAHGMDHNAGALGKSIRSMRIMMPDGTVKKVSKTENMELYDLIIGGYGLFGIIIDAELDIVDNDVYKSERKVTNYKEFPTYFTNEIVNNKDIGLMYGHLSTSPGSFLKEMIIYTYRSTDETHGEIPPLGEVGSIKLRRFIFNLAKEGAIPMRLKWFAEKRIEPLIESCPISRNQAMGEEEACLVSRNEPMHDSVKYLKNNLKNDTDILHEYFIPRANFSAFIDGMREIFNKNGSRLLNASVRVVHKEDNFLNYAPQDAFAIVLYINQETDSAGNEKMVALTQDLIDLSTIHGGRFFLPYQLHYTSEQLKKSYPEIDKFFAAKKKYDPSQILSNTFYEKYSRKY